MTEKQKNDFKSLVFDLTKDQQIKYSGKEPLMEWKTGEKPTFNSDFLALLPKNILGKLQVLINELKVD